MARHLNLASRGYGQITQGADHATWAAQVKQLGGVATVWPFSSSNYGEPAARFDPATYSDLVNTGELSGIGSKTTANGAWVYVLATAMTGTSDVVNTYDNSAQATDAEAALAGPDPNSLAGKIAAVEGELGTAGKFLLWGSVGLGLFWVFRKLK